MRDKAMARKLADRDAIDVRDCPRTVAGDYVLAIFQAGIEYCDSKYEVWIVSIGEVTRPLPSKMADGSARVLQPGEFLASRTARFYTPELDTPTRCVFWR